MILAFKATGKGHQPPEKIDMCVSLLCLHNMMRRRSKMFRRKMTRRKMLRRKMMIRITNGTKRK